MAKKKEHIEVNKHLLNTITPMGIKFNEKNLWFGEKMATVLVINKYPVEAKAGWLTRVANADGVVCSMHMTPTSSNLLIENISRSMGELAARRDGRGDALTKMRADRKYKHAEKLITIIDEENESVFYVTIVLMVIGDDKEDLDKKYKKVQTLMSGSGMRGSAAVLYQREALLGASPYGEVPEVILNIGNRNMPASTVAGAFPFDTSGLNDGKGWIFGKDIRDGIILLDSWKRGGDRINSNWTILGDPGVGKTTAVQHIVLSEYALGTKIIMLDPEREQRELCKNLNGQWINCGVGGINVFQIKDLPLDDEDEDEEDRLFSGDTSSALAMHFQTLRIFFKLKIPELDGELMSTLEEVLEELYKEHGIVWNTDVSTIEPTQYPLMKGLYELLLKKREEAELEIDKAEYRRLAKFIRSMAIGADSFIFNTHTTIKDEKDFMTLDIHRLQDYDDNTKRAQYFNTLSWIWNLVSKDRKEKILAAIDEAYLIADEEVPEALKYVRNFSKRVRKYMGGLLVISHSAVDFLDPKIKKHGQALLDNPCFKLFMGTDGQNLKELSHLMNFTEAEEDLLLRKKRGHGLLIAGSKRIHARVELAPHELEIFGSGKGI